MVYPLGMAAPRLARSQGAPNLPRPVAKRMIVEEGSDCNDMEAFRSRQQLNWMEQQLSAQDGDYASPNVVLPLNLRGTRSCSPISGGASYFQASANRPLSPNSSSVRTDDFIALHAAKKEAQEKRNAAAKAVRMAAEARAKAALESRKKAEQVAARLSSRSPTRSEDSGDRSPSLRSPRSIPDSLEMGTQATERQAAEEERMAADRQAEEIRMEAEKRVIALGERVAAVKARQKFCTIQEEVDSDEGLSNCSEEDAAWAVVARLAAGGSAKRAKEERLAAWKASVAWEESASVNSAISAAAAAAKDGRMAAERKALVQEIMVTEAATRALEQHIIAEQNTKQMLCTQDVTTAAKAEQSIAENQAAAESVREESAAAENLQIKDSFSDFVRKSFSPRRSDDAATTKREEGSIRGTSVTPEPSTVEAKVEMDRLAAEAAAKAAREECIAAVNQLGQEERIAIQQNLEKKKQAAEDAAKMEERLAAEKMAVEKWLAEAVAAKAQYQEERRAAEQRASEERFAAEAAAKEYTKATVAAAKASVQAVEGSPPQKFSPRRSAEEERWLNAEVLAAKAREERFQQLKEKSRSPCREQVAAPKETVPAKTTMGVSGASARPARPTSRSKAWERIQKAKLDKKKQEPVPIELMNFPQLVSALVQECDMPRMALEKCSVQRLRMLLRQSRASKRNLPSCEAMDAKGNAQSSDLTDACAPSKAQAVASLREEFEEERCNAQQLMYQLELLKAACSGGTASSPSPKGDFRQIPPSALTSLYRQFAQSRAQEALQHRQEERLKTSFQRRRDAEYAAWVSPAVEITGDAGASSVPVASSPDQRLRKIDYYLNAKERTRALLASPRLVRRSRSWSTRREKDEDVATHGKKDEDVASDDCHMQLLDFTLGG